MAQGAITGFERCRAALVDQGLHSEMDRAHGLPSRATNLLLMDGADHRALRKVVTDQLGAIDRVWLHGELDRASGDLLTDLPEEADLVADYVVPLVAGLALRLVGHPPTDQRLVAAVALTRGTLDLAADDPSTVDASRLIGLAVHLSRRPAPDGIEARLAAAVEAGAISAAQATFTPAVVAHGAFENPVNLLALMLARVVAERPPLADDTARDAYADRIVRESTPVRRVVRWASAARPDLGVVGGDAVWVDLATPTPPPARGGGPGLAFGHGAHRCPGVPATRVLTRVVLRHAADWAPRATFVEAQEASTWAMRGLARLDVRWSP